MKNNDKLKADNKPGKGGADKSEKLYGALPGSVLEFFETVGGIAVFTKDFFKEVLKPPYEVEETLNQLYQLGYKSLMLVGLSGFIIGLVLTLQVRPIMVSFGAESYIPTMVTISIVREIGPVLTALICAGKVGSGIGAELGSMKVTEQIDAIAVSGVNAFNYTVVTRVLAITLMVPLLVYYAILLSLLGSFIGVNLEGQVSLQLFILKSISAISFADIVPSTIKSFFFGFAIGIVSCYKGYTASKGTLGVGSAANSSVVMASMLIFIVDMIAVQLTQLLGSGQ